jgi:hypothetical protein
MHNCFPVGAQTVKIFRGVVSQAVVSFCKRFVKGSVVILSRYLIYVKNMGQDHMAAYISTILDAVRSEVTGRNELGDLNDIS